MNDQPNFTSILDKHADSLEAPKPVPVGTYLALISGPETYSKVGANQTDLVSWPVKLIQPQGDVDMTALNESLSQKDGTTRALGDAKLKFDQFLTEASAFMVRDFLQNTLDIDPKGKTLRQMISEALGKQMLVTITHGLTKGDNPRVFAQIKSTAKV
jgi:hypothetical protein